MREAVALGKYEKMKVLQTMYDIRDGDSCSGSGTVRVGGKAAAGQGGALPPCESEDVIQSYVATQSYAATQSRGEASTSAHASRAAVPWQTVFTRNASSICWPSGW